MDGVRIFSTTAVQLMKTALLFGYGRYRTPQRLTLGQDGFLSDRDRLPTRRSSTRGRRNHSANVDDMGLPIRTRAGHQPRNSNDNNVGDSGPRIGVNYGSITSDWINTRLSSSNRRLPASVLQARARLIERFRSFYISPYRQDEAASSIPWDDEYRELVAGRNSVESGRPILSSLHQDRYPIFDRRGGNFLRRPRQAVGSSSSSLLEFDRFGDLIQRFQSQHSDFRSGQSHGFPPPQHWIRNSPGLSSEAIHNLLHEVFQEGEHGNGGMHSDCPICLESFEEGDGLLRLHCGHRFHTACLEQWLRTCGDCPYCRARI